MCRYNPMNYNIGVKGYMFIPKYDEAALKAAVATVGPISVAIDARHFSFTAYEEGVYYEPNCETDNPNHAVLIVGYGTDEKNQNYWIVKNSWGEEKNERGYIKMARDRNNNCGIASYPIFPLV